MLNLLWCVFSPQRQAVSFKAPSLIGEIAVVGLKTTLPQQRVFDVSLVFSLEGDFIERGEVFSGRR
jgi:hypothetical protein